MKNVDWNVFIFFFCLLLLPVPSYLYLYKQYKETSCFLAKVIPLMNCIGTSCTILTYFSIDIHDNTQKKDFPKSPGQPLFPFLELSYLYLLCHHTCMSRHAQSQLFHYLSNPHNYPGKKLFLLLWAITEAFNSLALWLCFYELDVICWVIIIHSPGIISLLLNTSCLTSLEYISPHGG